MSVGSLRDQSVRTRSHAKPKGVFGKLTVTTLGGLVLRYADRPLELTSRKAKALVAYLALMPNGVVSREHIVGLFWSEVAEEKARASLRQVVRSLRGAFDDAGFDGLFVGRTEIALDHSRIELDVAEMLNAAKEASVHPRLMDCERIADTLLLGYDDLDPALRNWLMVQRENLSQRLIRNLEVILEQSNAGCPDDKAAAEALVMLDPTHEAACRHLIHRYAVAGDTAYALSVYNRLWELLEQEYDAEPSELTQALIADVKLGAVAAPAPKTRPEVHPQDATQPVQPGREAAQLALLIGHFDLDGVAEEQRHICIGFRSELMSTLLRFRAWSIVDAARTKTGANANGNAQLCYLLRGQLYQDQDNVHLVLDLQQPNSGVLIWSERFILGLDNYFAAQEEIVRKIAYSLNVHISHERLRQVSGQPDISLDVYDRWLRGHAFVLTWKPDLRERAVEIFQSIINDTPEFAPAYSSLVGVLNSNQFVYPGTLRTREVQQEALRLAKKAVEIDPLDSRSQLHLAWSQAMNDEHGIAELSFELACELNDNDPWTIASAAGGFAFCGRAKRGLELSKKGLKLSIAPSPMVWAYTACVRYINADYKGCVEACAHSQDEILVMLGWKIAALSKLGCHEEAAAEVTQLFRRVRQNWHGQVDPNNDAVINWLVQCFPISNGDLVEGLRTSLRTSAGLVL